MAEDRLGDTTVRTSALTSLFRHNAWANAKMLDYCAGLGEEQLHSTAVGTYGSIRGTLAHLVVAEADYVARATGKSLPAWMSGEEFPGFEALKDTVRWTGEELAQLAIGAPAGAIVREDLPEEHVVVEYPLTGLLVQSINHSTEHRAQIATIITQLGLEPPQMDGWVWLEEMGEFKEQKT